MNKILKTMMLAAVTAFGLASCEDVPAPFIEPEMPGAGGGEDITLPYTSANLKDGFEVYTTTGTGWSLGNTYAKASGYNSGSTTASETYLVSPAIPLGDAEQVYVDFDYVIAYTNSLGLEEGHQVLVCTEYDSTDPSKSNWVKLPFDPKEREDRSSWEMYPANTMSIPAEFLGQTIRIAFLYKCNSSSASTWELTNLSVSTEPGGEVTPDTPDTPTDGENALPYTSTNLKDGFEVYTPTGNAWGLGNTYAKATGYNSGSTTASETYLISPAITLGNAEQVYVDFDYVIAYTNSLGLEEGHQVLVCTEYDSTDPSKSNWVKLPFDPKEREDRSSWEMYPANTMSIPAEFLGQTIRIAFLYKCNSSSASTWELTNLKVSTEPSGEVTPDTPTEDEYALPYTSANLKDGFKVQTPTGNAWSLGNTYAKATGYNSGSTTASETYLISPAITLGNAEQVYVDFDYVIAYTNSLGLEEGHQVLVCTEYDSTDPSKSNWVKLPFDPKEREDRSSWEMYPANTMSIPAEFLGQTIRIAFLYKCNSSGASTWELTNLSVSTEPGGEETPETESDASNFKASDLGLSNGAAFTSVTVYGVTISADGGGNQNSPKYYDNGSNLRMYPQNTITISTEKVIKTIKLTCSSGYVASGDVETDKGTTSVKDPTIIINDIYDKSITLTNTSTTTGAPSQVRIERFEITYAE